MDCRIRCSSRWVGDAQGKAWSFRVPRPERGQGVPANVVRHGLHMFEFTTIFGAAIVPNDGHARHRHKTGGGA